MKWMRIAVVLVVGIAGPVTAAVAQELDADGVRQHALDRDCTVFDADASMLTYRFGSDESYLVSKETHTVDRGAYELKADGLIKTGRGNYRFEINNGLILTHYLDGITTSSLCM